jgi:hypothetical protein
MIAKEPNDKNKMYRTKLRVQDVSYLEKDTVQEEVYTKTRRARCMEYIALITIHRI